MPSTAISYYKYDPDRMSLRVRFVSGLLYEYKNVPERVYAALKKATSKGGFLNRVIKGSYDYEKIEE